jgi:hypothetical protein
MTLDNVKIAIEKLEAINPEEECAYEKAILTFLSINKLPILYCEIPRNTIVFRARTHETNKYFESVSDISIAPNSLAKSFARCSRPFQSKFYCSENRPTSFMELADNWAESKDFGDKIYVSIGCWKLNKSLRVIIITTPDKDNRISSFDKYFGTYIDKYISECNPDIKEPVIVFYRYLFDIFRKSAKIDTKTYIITTAYCNLALMRSIDKIHGICYPSVPYQEQGINLAINSDFAKSDNFELTSIIRSEIIVIENENKKKSFKEIASSKAIKIDMINNIIEW